MTDKTAPFRCPSNGPGRWEAVLQQIDAWLRAPALSQLVMAFDSVVPDEADLRGLAGWLLEFSDRWDFRKLQQEARTRDTGEGARWLTDDSQFDGEQRALIERCAAELGLRGADHPSAQTYDYALVLGGAKLSCLLRPRLAAEIIVGQGVQVGEVVVLGSSRPVSDSEREATDTYAPDALTEFDLARAGAEEAFNVGTGSDEERFEDPENTNRSWRVWRYEVPEKHPPVVALCAPSSEPDKRRANSADTYEFFLSKFQVAAGSSVLLVTSEIYVPYQQLEAIRTIALPHDLVVETVGFPAEWGGALQGMAGPTNYLQEVRSTIQAASRFIHSYPLAS